MRKPGSRIERHLFMSPGEQAGTGMIAGLTIIFGIVALPW